MYMFVHCRLCGLLFEFSRLISPKERKKKKQTTKPPPFFFLVQFSQCLSVESRKEG